MSLLEQVLFIRLYCKPGFLLFYEVIKALTLFLYIYCIQVRWPFGHSFGQTSQRRYESKSAKTPRPATRPLTRGGKVNILNNTFSQHFCIIKCHCFIINRVTHISRHQNRLMTKELHTHIRAAYTLRTNTLFYSICKPYTAVGILLYSLQKPSVVPWKIWNIMSLYIKSSS